MLTKAVEPRGYLRIETTEHELPSNVYTITLTADSEGFDSVTELAEGTALAIKRTHLQSRIDLLQKELDAL